MSISRSAFTLGPAFVQFTPAGGSLTSFFSKDDIDVNLDISTLDIPSSAFGVVSGRAIEVAGKVGFTPVGAWNAAVLPVLWPYQTVGYGADAFGGATDQLLALNGLDGYLLKLYASAITKMPSIHLSASKTIIGAVEFTGLRKNTQEWDAGTSLDGSLLSFAATGAAAAPNLTPGEIAVCPYTATWGSVAGFAAFQTQDGWTIDFEVNLKPIPADDVGIATMKVESVSVMAKCVPIGPTGLQILAASRLQGTGNTRGHDIHFLSDNATATPDLVITGTGTGSPIVTIKSAAIKTSGFVFGSTTLRNKEIGFINTIPSTIASQTVSAFTLAVQ